uniref:Uncharacterized protein n=1 Tax=Panagrolaimus sp. JU765 TaxID=591449 RepID=A0AC34PV56_9BILA
MLSYIKFASRLASELLSYDANIGSLLIVAVFTISATLLKGLFGSNENSGLGKFYAVYFTLIFVQLIITISKCSIDVECSRSYFGLLFAYFVLNIIVAVLRCHQPNETEKIYCRMTPKNIYVVCMQFALLFLALKSPKILAFGWWMVFEIDAADWLLKLPCVSKWIENSKENLPELANYLPVCVITASELFGTLAESLCFGNDELSSSDSTPRTSLSPFFNETVEKVKGTPK